MRKLLGPPSRPRFLPGLAGILMMLLLLDVVLCLLFILSVQGIPQLLLQVHTLWCNLRSGIGPAGKDIVQLLWRLRPQAVLNEQQTGLEDVPWLHCRDHPVGHELFQLRLGPGPEAVPGCIVQHAHCRPTLLEVQAYVIPKLLPEARKMLAGDRALTGTTL